MSNAAWKHTDAASLYQVDGWGGGYFSVNEKGNVEALSNTGKPVDLKVLCDKLAAKGVHPPLLLRFSDMLKGRMEQIHKRFSIAIAEAEYGSNYFGVYPIKVNQQYQVVEEVVEFGAGLHWGLEAGSKPELHATLAMLDDIEGIIVCNGYKDQGYIELALMGLKLGKQVFIVVEKPSELALILSTAKRIGIDPLIGLRCRLATTSNGFWDDSGGDKSKFGLSASELLDAIKRLSESGMLASLKLLHFHIGSQVPEVRRIKEAMQEAAHYYAEAQCMGAPIEFVDVGGGLGVNYDGSISNSASSVDYSLQEYANVIIWTMKEVCEEQGLNEPHIISESGRALVAHHAVLVVNTLGIASRTSHRPPETPSEDSPVQLRRLWETLINLAEIPPREALHDAVSFREDINRLFSLGHANLKERAQADDIYWHLITLLMTQLDENEINQIMPELNVQSADRYFCNFSVFQSLPDAWAINQVFPVMPIHRLDEAPARQGVLVDITCDSDGNIQQFPLKKGISKTLPLHSEVPGEKYLLGIFLIGAYQEILGDLHNLFGDTHTVHIRTDGEDLKIDQVTEGESISKVLDHVQFRETVLIDRLHRQIQSACASGRLSHREASAFLHFYQQGLQGYTYLEEDAPHLT